MDTKKKELVGNFKNNGREWQPKGAPEKALVHDFPTNAIGVDLIANTKIDAGLRVNAKIDQPPNRLLK